MTHPENFAFAESLGASAVFDYRDPEVMPKVKAAVHDSIHAAPDTISWQELQGISAALITPDGGRVTHTQQVRTKTMRGRTSSAEVSVIVRGREAWTHLINDLQPCTWTDYMGHDTPSLPETKTRVDEFPKNVPGLVRVGKIRPLPIKDLGSRLE